jgi:hypothetical protein
MDSTKSCQMVYYMTDTTNEKTLENRIFDLKHRDYNQKKISWIYLDSASLAVQNTNKKLI